MLVIAQRMFTSVDSFPLLAIPLFMVAGNLMEGGGISRRLINFCNSLLGGFTGGLAMVAVLTCMLFAAISGSGPATVAAIGGIMIPEMEKAGYPKAFSAALLSVAGGIGVIIPPSLPMVNYAVSAGGSVSISNLFAAGFGPGILVGLVLMVICYFSSKKYGYGQKNRVPLLPAQCGQELCECHLGPDHACHRVGWHLRWHLLPRPKPLPWPRSTASSWVHSSIQDLKLKDLPQLLMNSGKGTAMVMIIVGAASSFGWILTSARIRMSSPPSW